VPDVLKREKSCLGIMISISNKNMQMMDFLVNGLHYLWNVKDIMVIVREIIHSNWVGEALKVIIYGKCFRKLMDDISDSTLK
jgi:hypothetical protein